MKIIILLCLIFCSSVWAQGFTVTPTDPDVDLKALKKPEFRPRPQVATSPSYLSPQKRDELLKKFIPEELKKMDEFDKDILYKSLLNYDNEKLIRKYPFLKKVNIDEIKKSL